MSAPAAATDLPTPRRLPRLALAADEWAVLRWLLPLALIHGALYLWLAPPWEHYDEPNHFQYAALMAQGNRHDTGVLAIEVTREIADSMVRHTFLEGRFQPDILSPEPVALGASQLAHPRLYYAVVGVPLSPLRYLPVEQQLYAARALSVLFYSLTVLAAWRIAVVVVPDEPSIQLAFPLLVLLTPSFADLMTAVNNDVLLNLAAATALLGAVYLLRDGPRPAGLLLVGLGLVVAVLSKRTGLALVPIVALALLWSLWRRRMRLSLMLIGIAIAAILLGAAALQPAPADAAHGQRAVLMPRAWLLRLDAAYLRLDIDVWIRSVTNPELIGLRYLSLAVVGFTSFWTRLGWGDIALGSGWDWTFALLAILALLGLARAARTLRGALPVWQWRVLGLFLLAVIVAWVALAARLHPLPPLNEAIYLPRGRYMFWAFIPTLWLLLLGLQWLLPPRLQQRGPWLVVGLFLVFDAAALLTLYAAHR